MTDLDTRPAVTVVGSLEVYVGGQWLLTFDEFPEGHPFRDGDEVEVTIKKLEPRLAREEAG